MPWLLRFYRAILATVAIMPPLIGILYLRFFTDSSFTFVSYPAYGLVIAIPILLALGIGSIAYYDYRKTPEVFLKFCALGCFGFAILYTLHGLSVFSAATQTNFLSTYGRASHLILAWYLFQSVAITNSPAVRKKTFRYHLLIIVLGGIILGALWRTGYLTSLHLQIMEGAALLFFITAMIFSELHRHGSGSRFKLIFMASLAIFSEASIGFLVSVPWTYAWWFSRFVFFLGFLVLGYVLLQRHRDIHYLGMIKDEVFLATPLLPRLTAAAGWTSLLLLLLLGSSSSGLIHSFIDKRLAINQEVAFKGIEQEKSYSLAQAIEVSKIPSIQEHIRTRNSVELLKELREEATARNLTGVSAVDRYGVVLSRLTSSKIGDSVFQTLKAGRLVARGEDATVIDRGSIYPLVISTGHPITANGEIEGAIFVGPRLDSTYAAMLKNRYFADRTDVVFYSARDGIVGDSFGDPAVSSLLTSYFNTGSQVNDFQDTILRLEGRMYAVRYLALSDDPEVGGMLLFVPLSARQWAIMSGIIGGMLFLAFLSLYHRIVLRKKNGVRRGQWWVFVIGFLINFFVIGWLSSYLLQEKILSINQPKYTIYNSVLRLTPESGIFDVSFPQTVAIELLSGGEAINAAGVTINYDPALAKVTEISTDKSFCDDQMFLEKEIDNAKGQVRITCTVPNPGFRGALGTLAELQLQPLKAGTLELSFATSSEVLANDGLGTNVLRLAVSGSYYDTVLAENTQAVQPVLLYSPSHPNSARWYKTTAVDFNWPGSADTEYSYLLDQYPTSTPQGETITRENKIKVDTKESGIYYFHIRPRKNGVWGPVVHRKLLIDAIPPTILIRQSQTTIAPNNILRLEASSDDTLSGLQGGYYIKIDKDIFLPTSPRIYIAFNQPGTHTIAFRTFDKAQNYRDVSTTVVVK